MKQAQAVQLMICYPQYYSALGESDESDQSGEFGVGGGDPLTQHIAQALQYERLAHALQQADADIAQRIETGEVAGFVEKFLEQHWRLVLAHAYCESDEAAWVRILKWMDELIWSVQPKFSNEQCQELLARLPALLEALSTTMDLSEWCGPEREAFFARLAERHANIVRGPVSARSKVEFAVNSAQKASERRWEHESRAQAMASDQSWYVVQAMQIGDCVELLNEAESALQYFKLAWSSPKKMVLVFVERGGQNFCSFTTAQLAQRIKENNARLVKSP
jgi:hypothetical protein